MSGGNTCLLRRKVKPDKVIKERKGQNRCYFTCGGQRRSDKRICGQRPEWRERLSCAAFCRESLPGRGNQKGKRSDMRKTQCVQGPVRARGPSVSGTRDISVWSSAYDTLPGSLPPCPAFPSPWLLLSLPQAFQASLNSQVNTHFISLVKSLLDTFFQYVPPACPPPFLRVLFSLLNFVTYYSYIKNLPKWTFKTCAPISGCGSPVLQLFRPKTSSRPDCLFSLTLNTYCISRLLSAQSLEHGRVQPPLPSPLQPKAPLSLAWITLTASLLLSPSSLSST